MHKPKAWVGIRPWQRHSLILLVAGLIYMSIGFFYTIAEPSKDRVISLEFALDLMPMRGWGVVFILTGLLAIVSSRWPPFSETWGYTTMTGLSAGWGCFYAVGWLFGEASTAILTTSLLWGLVAFLWWAISGLLNPSGPRSSPTAVTTNND